MLMYATDYESIRKQFIMKDRDEHTFDPHDKTKMDDAITYALKCAFKDFNFRTLTAKKPISGNRTDYLVKKLKNAGFQNRFYKFFSEKPLKNESDFDKWHHDACQCFLNVLKDYYEGIRYGKAQKIVNMMFKHLYCLDGVNSANGAKNYDGYFEFCHMPLDSFTIEWFVRNVAEWYNKRGKPNNKIEKIKIDRQNGPIPNWSNIQFLDKFLDNSGAWWKYNFGIYDSNADTRFEESQKIRTDDGKYISHYHYMFFVTMIREYFKTSPGIYSGLTPFQAEFYIWPEIQLHLAAEALFAQKIGGEDECIHFVEEKLGKESELLDFKTAQKEFKAFQLKDKLPILEGILRSYNQCKGSAQSTAMSLSNYLINFLRDHESYIENESYHELLEIASVSSQQGFYRELLHTLLSVTVPTMELPKVFPEYRYLQLFELNGVPLAVYSDSQSVITALQDKRDSELLNTLIPLMKKYHCCVDHSFPSLNFDTKSRVHEDERLIVIISTIEKTVFDSSEPLYSSLSKCEILLWEKYHEKNTSPIQLFFLLTFYSIDAIKLKSREEMEKHWEEMEKHFSHPNEDPYKQCPYKEPSELLGCYFYQCDRADLFNRDQQIIYLCPELINTFSQELYNNNFLCYGGDFLTFYDLIYELVLLHELGHLAFSCLKMTGQDTSLTEGRANFFASYITNGVHDYLIKLETQHQPAQYHAPILITDSDWKVKLHL